jgi:hypothetical protein
VNSDLRRIFEWSRSNLLRLNPANPWAADPIFNGHLLGPLSPLFLGDDFIPYLYKAKNLGVPLIYDLSWGDHVSTVCRMVYGAFAGFRRLTDVTPFAVRYATYGCPRDSIFHLLRLCILCT